MNARAVLLAIAAGVAAFLLSAIAVIELLLPTMEFSVFVALPVGLFVGAAVTALVLFGYGRDGESRVLATAFGTFAIAFLLVFAALLFVVGIGAVVSLLGAVIVGVIVAVAVAVRSRQGTE